MIRVFKPADKVFVSNGDAILHPFRAVVHKEDNSDFYLDIECGLDAVEHLSAGNIVIAPTPQGEQAFRVSDPDITKSKISVRCWHVFYDAENYLIADSYVVDKTGNEAINWLNDATEPESPFTVTSDSVVINSYRCVRESLAQAFEVFRERWGGHLIRDNFSIAFRQNIGVDKGIIIQYGKNIKELTSEERWEDVVTKILPVGKDGILLNYLDPTVDIYMTADVQYPIPFCKTVSFDQDLNEDDYPSEMAYFEALLEDLRSKAQAYLDEHKYPEINYTLKAHIEQTVDIGDKIEVRDHRLGLDLLTDVIAYSYDCILDRYTEIEFGNFKPTLIGLVPQILQEASSEVAEQVDGKVDKEAGKGLSTNDFTNADKIKLDSINPSDYARIDDVVTSVNGMKGDVTISAGGSPVLLWSNSNPSTAFAEQEVTISTATDYTMLLGVFCLQSSNTATVVTQILIKGKTTRASIMWTGSNTTIFASRGVSFSHASDTLTVHFYGGYYKVAGTITQDNARCIPVAVYGWF